MAGEPILTVVGNLIADPELRNTPSGASLASFTVASTPRTYNRNSGKYEDGATLFMRCTAWNDLATHCVNSIHKGVRVIVQGRVVQNSFVAKDGSKRNTIEMIVDDIGPSLRYATAQVNRIASHSGFVGNANAGQQGSDSGFNNGAYAGGGYAGGANYANANATANGISASVPGNDAPAEDPWSASAPSNDGFATFGATSDFGGANDEPEF